jgi:hypothetical protein
MEREEFRILPLGKEFTTPQLMLLAKLLAAAKSHGGHMTVGKDTDRY